MMKIVIHQSELDGKHYVAFKAANNETWFTSEGYESVSNALRSVRDFFETLGKQGFIEDGVVGFNVDIQIIDAHGHAREAKVGE